ncbi:MAG: PQQ-binding-like beta-propeller repeat protein, partial [Dehalococcoidia bacterium]
CQSCGHLIARVPPWVVFGRRRRRYFTRRRLVLAAVALLLAVFVFWLNFPFLPDPMILLFNRPTTSLTTQTLPGQWPMNGGDLQQRRYVADALGELAGQISWSVDLGEPTRSAPIVVENVIYMGGYFQIVALDIESGRTLWAKQTSGPVHSSLAAAGDNLYVGLLDHRLLALDIKTGETRWGFLTQDIVTAAPVVAKGIVYVGSWDHYMYALDAADGNLIWKFQADARINNSPAVHKGSLFVTDSAGNLHVLSARTGQERLLYRAPGTSTRPPVVAHGLVYFLSAGRIYAVDAGARRIPLQFQLKKVWAQLWLWQVPGIPRPPGQRGGLWRFSPADPKEGFAAAPAVTVEAFYLGDVQGNFYAQEALLGTDLWRFRAGASIVASPVVVGDRVYFGAKDGEIYALDRFTGELLWRLDLGASIQVSPVFAAGRLLVQTADGRVHAIE